jgi:catechol 2,3-dioxygenase-like lactoylglutathione lyase family enzyme
LRLEYVGLRVRDLDRSVRFYPRLFGLREVKRGDFREDGRGIWVGLTDPESGARLELNWYPPGSRYGTRYVPGEGLDHVGFSVPKPQLSRVYQRLLALGARPTGVDPKSTEGWPAYLLDPDGNWVELSGIPPTRRRRPRRRAAAVRRPTRAR